MLLAIDVGNANTVFGVFAGDELEHHWRVSTETHRTPDEVALTLQGLLTFAGVRPSLDLHGVVLGSVVPSVTEVYREMAERYFTFAPVVVEPGTRTGLPVNVDNPRDIGADRITNAVAAAELYGAPSIVVDFETAITFDAVDRSGAFVGGAIAPGVHLASEALTDQAARLPKVEVARPTAVIGRTTVAAMQSGVVHGFAGLVDAIVRRMAAELGPGVTTVATGGLAGPVLESCETLDHQDPWLTLKGLRLVWERNAR